MSYDVIELFNMSERASNSPDNFSLDIEFDRSLRFNFKHAKLYKIFIHGALRIAPSLRVSNNQYKDHTNFSVYGK